MLTIEQNQLLTRVGSGTPMGRLMRRYWVPALLSWELPEPNCEPVEVRLLGEDLVAFRDTVGSIGVVSAFCAHRRASLFWGRNEESGLRCVYHGWKFNVDGRCVDMPSEPSESNFKDSVRIPAYPAYEAGGVVWIFMGQPEATPAFPHFEWTQVPKERRALSKVLQESNWLQGFEGGIDMVHANFLHAGRPPGKAYDEGTASGRANNISTSAQIQVVSTDYGFSYAGIRKISGDQNLVRAYHWVMPWTQLRAQGSGVAGHMWVPVDDNETMVFNWHYYYSTDSIPQDRRRNRPDLHEAIEVDLTKPWYRHAHLNPGTGNDFVTDVDHVNFRAIRNRGNKYMIDRELQRTETFTGIQGVNTQDRAVQESMGNIADRSLERLGTSDRAIIAARRALLTAIDANESGKEPPGVSPNYYRIRPKEQVLPSDVNWFEAMKPDLYQIEMPPLTT